MRRFLMNLAEVPGPIESAGIFWRWLRRMRTALYLLGLVGVATLIATVVPQQPNVPDTVARWLDGTEGPGVTIAEAYRLLGFYDVYGSPWFLALVVLLFTSLTACLVPRYRAYLRSLRRGAPPATSAPERKPMLAHVVTAESPDTVRAEARALLRRRRFRLRASASHPPAAPVRSDMRGVVVPAPADTADSSGSDGFEEQVAAERGAAAREGGSLAFHSAFYLLLIGVVAGQLFGFRGQVGVVEGESFAETAVAYWSNMGGRLWDDDWHRGFVFTLDEFEVDWTPAGQPSRFVSHYTVEFPDGREPRRGDLRVNDPLVVDGMKIHQLDWGYAPRVVVADEGEVVFDAFVPLSATDEGLWRGAVKVPAADPQVGLEIVLVPTAPEEDDGRPLFTTWPDALAPLLLYQAWEGDLRLDRIQGIHELDTTRMVEVGVGGLRPGSDEDIRDGTVVSFPELRRWSGLQVSRRAADPLLLLAAGLIIAALFPALYAYRRRIWVLAEADPGSGTTRVTVAGQALQRREAFETEFQEVVEALRDRLGSPATPDSKTETSSPSEAVRR